MTEAGKCLKELGGKCPHCNRSAGIIIQRSANSRAYIILKCRDCFDAFPELYYPEEMRKILDAKANPFTMEVEI